MNPDKTGELSTLCYMIDNLDLSNPDVDILANPNWLPFCVKSVDRSKTFNTREVMDRCNPNELVYSLGRSDSSLSFELNQFRWSLGGLVRFNNAVEERAVVSVLAINSSKDDPDAWGWVGNFHVTEQSITEPEDGLNTESYTLVPSVQGTIRWVYGSTFGPDTDPTNDGFSPGYSLGFAS